MEKKGLSVVASAFFEGQYNVCFDRVKIWSNKHIFRNLIFSKWAAYQMVFQISNHEFRIFTIGRSSCQKCFAAIRDWKTRETMQLNNECHIWFNIDVQSFI